ncbi:MAG: DNA primase [Nitrospirae bacterium]|nr:DNA primase [Nitrospirota bacterium]
MDGHIPEEIVTKVIESQDIVEVISRYISLKKKGQNHIGLCPFHSEKTPSFVVSQAKQLFHCFGCGTGGNVISFLMRHENSTFTEVVRRLGNDAGIIIERAVKENKSENFIFDINNIVSASYHENLIKTNEAEPARAYLLKRGLTIEIIKRFNIGYSPDSWNSIYNLLKKKGFHEDLMLKSGVIIPQNKGTGYYDRFRKRIMFPIFDIQKRVVGFGGRVMDNSTPKYLNSPETPVFTKGNLLYGLETAKEGIKESGFAIIVEGYIDVVTAHQAGVLNVVATLGTALTPNHIRILQRFCKEVILTFDSDTAGIKAALRTVDNFVGSEVEAKVLLLPEGEDPDSFIRKYGKTAFDELISKSKGIIEFAIDMIINKKTSMNIAIPKTHIDAKFKNAEECLNLIRKIPNRIEQDYHLNRVSNDLKIEKDVLYAELRRKGKGKKSVQPETAKNNDVQNVSVEETLLALVIKYKELRKQAREKFDVRYLVNTKFQKTVEYIINSDKDLNDLLNTEFIGKDSQDTQEMRDIITRLALSDLHFDLPEKNLLDCMRAIRRESLNRELKGIEQEISKAELAGAFDKVRSLLVLKQGLLQQRKLLYEN